MVIGQLTMQQLSCGDLAPNLGGTENFVRGPRFLNDVFIGKNFHHCQGKNFWWHFLVIDLVFLFPDFPYLYYVKCRIWPFPHKKSTFFYSVHTFTRIRQHYFSKYWGDQCMGRPPPPQIWRGGPATTVHFTFRFYNYTICDQLHVKICPGLLCVRTTTHYTVECLITQLC